MLRRLEDRLDLPMALLGLAWLGILIAELVRGLGPVRDCRASPASRIVRKSKPARRLPPSVSTRHP